jgi:hypothetical protein
MGGLCTFKNTSCSLNFEKLVVSKMHCVAVCKAEAQLLVDPLNTVMHFAYEPSYLCNLLSRLNNN